MAHSCDKSVRFTASSAVTDCDQVHFVLFSESGDIIARFGDALLRFVRKDDAVIDKLTVLIENSHLTTGTEARVEGENGVVTGRRSEKNVLKVFAEHLERFFFGFVLQEQADFAFEARLEQTIPSVLAHFFQIRFPDAVALDHLALQVADKSFIRHFHGKTENLFLFATAKGKHTVARNLRNRFGEVVVVLELGFLLFEFLADLRRHDAFLFDLRTQILTAGRVVSEFFSENVTGASDCRLRIGKALFFGEVNPADFFRRVGGFFLSHDDTSERFETAFLRNRRTGTLFRLVRSVKVFEKGLFLAGFDLCLKFRSQLALFFDGLQNSRLTVFNFLQIFTAVLDVTEFDFIQRSRLVLAVTRNKRNRTALVHQFQGFGHTPFF